MKIRSKLIAALLCGTLIFSNGTWVLAAEPDTTQAMEEDIVEDTIENVEENNSLTAETEKKLEFLAATDLKISSTGDIEFTNPNSEEMTYGIQFFRDGIPIAWFYGCVVDPYETRTEFMTCLDQPGEYCFVVVFTDGILEPGNNLMDLPCVCSEKSETINFVLPSEKIAVPTNVRCTKGGLCTWDAVSNARAYAIELYDENMNLICTHAYATEPYTYFDECVEDGKTYYIKVQAISNDFSAYQDSDYSEEISFICHKYNSATNVQWTSNGDITFESNNVADDNLINFVLIYKDEEFFDAIEATDNYVHTSYYINESGNYTAYVYTMDYYPENDVAYHRVGLSEVSETFTYVIPKEVISIPTNMSITSDNRLTWNKDEHVDFYNIEIYLCSDELGHDYACIEVFDTTDNFINIPDYDADKSLCVHITSYSKDITKWAHCPFVKTVDIVHGNPQENSNPTPAPAPAPTPSATPASVTSSVTSAVKPLPGAVKANIITGPITEMPISATQMGLVMNGNTVLDDQFLAGYKAKNMSVLAFMDQYIGYTIDTNQDLTTVDLATSVEMMPTFAPGFDTMHVKVENEKELPFSIGMNVNIGEQYAGKRVYVFKKNLTTVSYDLYSAEIVNEIGNIAITSSTLSDIMILIQ